MPRDSAPKPRSRFMAPCIDVRGLPPPEPFENIVRALQTLSGADTLQVLIHREPLPLYEMLRGAGYAWQTTALADGDFEILITIMSQTTQNDESSAP